MTGEKEPKGRIDRILAGDSFEVSGHLLEPVAKVGGWYGGTGDERSGGRGAWVRVQPLEMRVKDPDGSEYGVPIADPTDDAVRNMVRMGLIVAAISVVLMLIGSILAKRD
jgi:hypothetical protein